MSQNFIGYDREQAFFAAPSLRVSEDHLVWTIPEVVEKMDPATTATAPPPTTRR
jgi:hypothetical protein